MQWGKGQKLTIPETSFGKIACKAVSSFTDNDQMNLLNEFSRGNCAASENDSCPLLCIEKQLDLEDYAFENHERPPKYLAHFNREGYADFSEEFATGDSIVINLYPHPWSTKLELIVTDEATTFEVFRITRIDDENKDIFRFEDTSVDLSFKMKYSRFDIRIQIRESQLEITFDARHDTITQIIPVIGLNLKKIKKLRINGGFASNIEHIGGKCNLLRNSETKFDYSPVVDSYADPTSSQYKSVMVENALKMPYHIKLSDPLHYVDGNFDIRTLLISGDYRAVKNPQIKVLFYNSRISMDKNLAQFVFANGSVVGGTDKKVRSKFGPSFAGIAFFGVLLVPHQIEIDLDANYNSSFDLAVIESNVAIYYARWFSSRIAKKSSCGYRAFEIDEVCRCLMIARL
ncbi:unnamed protein product [Caenorhabditis bovis]|uniref:Galectin n=1 Tax=Caenorhabditis bovis TaxID=2654633 RepID=A0A8S1F9S8_9PELO|nr:unnamed protein product [Caenorhabditis bovis]